MALSSPSAWNPEEMNGFQLPLGQLNAVYKGKTFLDKTLAYCLWNFEYQQPTKVSLCTKIFGGDTGIVILSWKGSETSYRVAYEILKPLWLCSRALGNCITVMRVLWKERFSLSLFAGKVRGVPRLLATSERTSPKMLYQVCSEDHWSLGFLWVYPEHWEGSCWVKQSSLSLLSLPLLQPHGNGTGAAPLTLGRDTTLDLFWHGCLVGSGIPRRPACFLMWATVHQMKWNEMHIRHSPIAAGGVQESLITAALGVVFFFFSWHVLNHRHSSGTSKDLAPLDIGVFAV